MNKYRASYGTLPADTLSTGGFTKSEQNLIDSMDNDDPHLSSITMYLARISGVAGSPFLRTRPR
jgi:hypothetical protein